jgi:antitoxin (DNA-binding transcriptional repressor) of toxin-antitoxin stability system
MRTINIHQAKTHLSWLIQRAILGEPFIIAKAGKPMVRVTAIDTPEESATRRIGFLTGEIAVPDDFDRMVPAPFDEAFGDRR